MNKSQQSLSLFSLLRLALDTKTEMADLSTFTKVEWQSLIDLSFEQGVAALAVDGLQRGIAHDNDGSTSLTTSSDNDNHEALEALDSPELEDLKYEWFGEVFQAEKDYQKYKAVIKSLARILSEHNQRLILLKGYALSQVYPIPEHRPLGDVDIYQGQVGDDTFVSEGMDVNSQYHKHSVFYVDGIMIENHHKFLNDIKHSSNRRFERILQQLNDSEDYPKEELMVGEQTVLLPNPTFNALFLLRHAGAHFTSKEISLRQIMDFGLYISQKRAQIDWPYVLEVFREEKMMPFYDAIGTICVEHLGMDLSAFEGLTVNKSLAERVLDDIFLPKEEGDVPDRKRHIVRYGLFMTRRWWRNRWKYKMVYNESLLDSFWTLALNRVRGEKG